MATSRRQFISALGESLVKPEINLWTENPKRFRQRTAAAIFTPDIVIDAVIDTMIDMIDALILKAGSSQAECGLFFPR